MIFSKQRFAGRFSGEARYDESPAEAKQYLDLLSVKRQPDPTTAGDFCRRAALITLSHYCLKCHMLNRNNARDRMAGLLVIIPLEPTPIQEK